MKITIITATYNSENTILDCIKSINNQTYQNIEHIIVDAKSKDKTLEIINSIPNRVQKIISEPDRGIYDAMNKGINIATGDIIAILNSDDFYADNKVIEKIVSMFNEKNVDSIFGNLDLVAFNNTEKIIRKWVSSNYEKGKFKKGWHPPHPTFFVKKEIYEKYGVFDITLDISADFELMLRFLEKQNISTFYLNETIVKMRFGGESTNSIKNIIKGNLNVLRAFKKNNIPAPFLYPVSRFIYKLKQYMSK